MDQVVGINATTTTSNNTVTTTTTTTTTTIIIPPSNNINNVNSSGISNCVSMNNGVCTQCISNYVVVSGQCQPLIPNCTAYNLLTGICITCANGYTLQNQNCVQSQITPTITNCQVVDPNNTSNCLICVYGYFPSGSTCQIVSSLCNGFNVQTGACFACLYSLTLLNGKCIDSNCLSINGNVCAICATNY